MFSHSISLSNNHSVSAPPHLQTLHSQMRFLMSKAKAPSTQKTQNSMLKSWFRFLQEYDVSMPVGGWNLALYATDLVVKGNVTTAESLANYVSATSIVLSILGM